MKATMITGDLREALKKVKPIKWNKQLPVLSSVLVEFSDGKASITSSDLERSVIVDIDSQTDSPFSTVISYKTLECFLYGANGKVSVINDPSPKPTQIILERDGLGQVALEIQHKQEDFLKRMPTGDLTWHSIDAKWFCHMLDILVTACAKEASRPILTGICCSEGAMASADGFRLVSVKDDRLVFGLDQKQVIIPSTTADLVRRLYRKEETLEVAFELTEQQAVSRVHFKSKRVSIDSELVAGSFPNYKILIPDTYNCKVSFSAPLMLQRLEMIDPMLYLGITRLQFQRDKEHSEHQCLITAIEQAVYKYSLTLPVKIETADEGNIAFNCTYLRDLLKFFSLVTLELTSPSAPGKFTGDIEEVTVVVMPMFVQWE